MINNGFFRRFQSCRVGKHSNLRTGRRLMDDCITAQYLIHLISISFIRKLDAAGKIFDIQTAAAFIHPDYTVITLQVFYGRCISITHIPKRITVHDKIAHAPVFPCPYTFCQQFQIHISFHITFQPVFDRNAYFTAFLFIRPYISHHGTDDSYMDTAAFFRKECIPA